MKHKKEIYVFLSFALIFSVVIVVSTFFSDELNMFFDSNEVITSEVDGPDKEDEFSNEDIGLLERKVEFNNGSSTTLSINSDLNIKVAAENLGKTRFMTMSPDGRVFVPDMVDYNLSHEGKIFILDDFDEEEGRFNSKTEYLSNLRGPNNVDFYTDEEGRDWIYITLTEHLIRYPYNEGDVSPSGDLEVIYEFPNEQSEGVDDVVWHITRTILFHGDDLYVSIGSGCNVCEEDEGDMRPLILKMSPEGEDVEVYAEGIKNAVGLEIVDDSLYATENGVDHLGDNAPSDLLYEVSEGEHYGWPYCYELQGKVYKDSSLDWENDFSCEEVPLSFVSFAPHSAPLGITYFEDFDSNLDESFLVALQGSWDPEIGTGYKVVQVSKEGEKKTLIDGFIKSNGERIGRPVHILQKDENSFFVSEDYNGRIYYIYK